MPGTFTSPLETQIGPVAYLFGILNNGTPFAMTGISSFELDSEDVSLTWTEKEKTDTQGRTQNITQTNYKYERTCKFNPSGASRVAAAAVCDSVFTLQNLVTANHRVSTLNGTWRIKPGTKLSLKVAEDASIDINVEKYVDTLQNIALTNAPIAG